MGCGCSPCELKARAMRGDPDARKLLALQGAHAATIGDLLPKVVGPADVDAIKRELEPSMQSTNAAVQSCTQLTAPEREAWGLFFKAWIAYRDVPTPWLFGTANIYDAGVVFRSQLAGWQAQLRTKCSIPGPVVVDEAEKDERALTAIKWASAAVVVVAVVWGVRSVVR